MVLLMLIFLAPAIKAETTFFDIPNDVFIMETSISPTQVTGETTGGGGRNKELELITSSEINITQRDKGGLEKEPEKQEETEKIDVRDKTLVYFIILIFVSVIFYWKRDYFKRLYNKCKK